MIPDWGRDVLPPPGSAGAPSTSPPPDIDHAVEELHEAITAPVPELPPVRPRPAAPPPAPERRPPVVAEPLARP
ncbi:MAG: hypothetical protein ACRDH5_13375, partial [bacterium]